MIHKIVFGEPSYSRNSFQFMDGVNSGYMMTTSFFSPHVEKMLHTMKVPVATVELVDKTRLEALIQRLAEVDNPVYLQEEQHVPLPTD